MAKPNVSYYDYDPSVPIAAVAAVLFTLACLGGAIQTVRYKSSVWWVMIVAAICEAIGFIARVPSARDPESRAVFIISFALIVLAPVLMAAACYVVFGRIVYHVVPPPARTAKLLWIPPRFLTLIFVGCDILALALQVIGAIQLVTPQVGDPDFKEKVDRGRLLAQVGVIVQLICFGMFSVIAIRFHFTSKRFATEFEQRIILSPITTEGGRKNEKYVEMEGFRGKVKKNWVAILRVTNIASICILIRSLYRLVEFSEGRGGYLYSHEWTLYVFDALMILPVVVLYVWWHPGKYLPHLGFRLPKEARTRN